MTYRSSGLKKSVMRDFLEDVIRTDGLEAIWTHVVHTQRAFAYAVILKIDKIDVIVVLQEESR